MINRLFFINENKSNLFLIDYNEFNAFNEIAETILKRQLLNNFVISIFSNLSPIEFNEIIKLEKLVGPILSFDSVFSTTMCQLLNVSKESHNLSAINIIRFEKLKIDPESYDNMLEVVYSLEDLNLHNTRELVNHNLPYDYKVEFSGRETSDINNQLSQIGIKFDKYEMDYYKE